VRVVHDDDPGTLADVPQADDRTTLFDAATTVRHGPDGGLVVELDPGWDVGGGILNGGYLLAVAARAALAESSHPHPVALSGSFLRAPAPGRAVVSVLPGPAGRTLAHGLVTLSDGAGPALVVQATTATLTSAVPERDRPAPDMPRVEDCVSLAANAHAAPPGLAVPGLVHRIETRLDPATAGWALGRPSGEPVLRAWLRFADDREPDPLALVAFADALPPTTFAAGRFGWAPTVQLQVLVRGLPAPGWCLVEARGGTLADGWHDEDYAIWDSTGRLVAQSRQLARAPR
jgi:acyl-coenzyme A thioesterase PaaI-like protein